MNYIKKNRIIGFETPEQLLDKLYNIFLESKEYLIRKCARAYTLYVKNNEINNIRIEEQVNLKLYNPLYKTIPLNKKPEIPIKTKYL